MPPTDAYGKPIQSFVDANAAKQATYQTQLAPSTPTRAAAGDDDAELDLAGCQQRVNYGTMGSAGPAIRNSWATTKPAAGAS